MINTNSCIVCSSADNLNTEFTITIDDEKVKVLVCDEHADDITPKLAKEKYLERKVKIDEFIAQARVLGLEVNLPTNPSEVSTAKAVPSAPKAAPTHQDIRPRATQSDVELPEDGFIEDLRGTPEDGVLDTRSSDAKIRSVKGVGGVIQGVGGQMGQVDAHSAYDRTTGTDKLDARHLEGRVKMGLTEGRGGQPMAIPEVRQDGTGTTHIKISQRIDDSKLQRRFKELASSAIQTPDGYAVNRHGFSFEGYDVTNCSMCRGGGTIKQSAAKTITCPRCDGAGTIGN